MLTQIYIHIKTTSVHFIFIFYLLFGPKIRIPHILTRDCLRFVCLFFLFAIAFVEARLVCTFSFKLIKLIYVLLISDWKTRTTIGHLFSWTVDVMATK